MSTVYNKVTFNGDTIMDISDTTATPETVAQGEYFYTANGTRSVGSMSGGAVDSVNGQTGTVILDADDVGALPDDTVIPTKTSDLTNDSGFITSVPVSSVNNKTGAVTLTASDVGALPSSTSIPSKTSDLTNDSGFLTSAVTSFNGNTGAVTYIAPVSSVNGQTGTVVLDADDVGALPDDTTYVSTFNGQSGAITYTAPVTSVNGSTGAVVISTATSSANGLMSATDKTHLDAVYADYSSALTALGV